MTEYIIDFKGVANWLEAYRTIIDALDFPQWCGRNPDAIWDMLTGFMEYPDVIYFRNFNSLPKSLDVIKERIKTAFEEAATFYEHISDRVTDENLCFRFEIID